jgi:hypothetical protein
MSGGIWLPVEAMLDSFFLCGDSDALRAETLAEGAMNSCPKTLALQLGGAPGHVSFGCLDQRLQPCFDLARLEFGETYI